MKEKKGTLSKVVVTKNLEIEIVKKEKQKRVRLDKEILKEHYVNNEEFLNAIREYRVFRVENPDKEHDVLMNYIGECFKKIATKYSHYRWFVGYSYRDELIDEGILVCMKAFRRGRFDENRDCGEGKLPNPFSYFTAVCHNAFRQYQMKELNQAKIKKECLVREIQSFSLQDGDDVNGRMYRNSRMKHATKMTFLHENELSEVVKKTEDELAAESDAKIVIDFETD